MKKLFCVITALVMSIMMMGCATCSDMSWARVEPVGETCTYCFISQEGDIRLYKGDGTSIFSKSDLREDAQYSIFDYGIAYVNSRSELILVSAITGESLVCDSNVVNLVGEAYSKSISEGVLLIAYKVNEDGDIVSANMFPEE